MKKLILKKQMKMNKLKELINRWRNSDPVKHCPVYKEDGCAFVDSFMCNFPHCYIYDDYNENKNELKD